jgi:hypothetical protein
MGRGLGYALFLLVSTVSGLLYQRRARKQASASAGVAGEIGAWASAAGFEVLEGTDLEANERAHAAFMLLGIEDQRGVGTALRRKQTRGLLFVFDSYRLDGHGERGTTAVLASPVMARGYAPELVVGLPEGSHCDYGPGFVAVHVPAPLDANVAGQVAERLTRLEATLPGIPGASRH